MKYLIDTHYLLWALLDPGKICNTIKDILINEDVGKYISPINLWEISLKYSLGKLELHGTDPQQLGETAIESGFHIAETDYQIFSTYFKLPKKDDHKDPFDRMLIWQAIQGDFTLISKDEKIEQYKSDGLKLIVGA